MKRPPCMTRQEYASWLRFNGELPAHLQAATVCDDCLRKWKRAQRALGICDDQRIRLNTEDEA